jgi:hypothetical protein
MRRLTVFLFKVFVQGTLTPPPTGIVLFLTAFIRILLLAFLLKMLIFRGLLKVEYPLNLIFLCHLIWMPMILYVMIEGAFSTIALYGTQRDTLSRAISVASTVVLTSAIVIVIWLMIIL